MANCCQVVRFGAQSMLVLCVSLAMTFCGTIDPVHGINIFFGGFRRCNNGLDFVVGVSQTNLGSKLQLGSSGIPYS